MAFKGLGLVSFCCCDKTLTESHLGKEEVVLPYTFRAQPIEESKDRNPMLSQVEEFCLLTH